MGVRTRTVGGGAATGTANAFQDFLRQQLGAPSQADGMQNVVNRVQGMGDGLNNHVAANNTRLNSNAQQPGQQTSAFGTAFQNAMSGQVNDQSGAGAQLHDYFQGGPQYGPQYTNQYQSQNYQGFDPSQLQTNFGQGQTGMADLSPYGNIGNTNVDVMQGFGQRGQSQMDPFMQQLFGQGQNMMQNGGFNGGASAQNVDMKGGLDYMGAYNQLGQDPLMERNRMLAVADQRARFGAEGAGALGTGAQFAEGTLNAQLNAQDASNRRGQAMQLMGQDLADRQAQAGVGLQNAGNSLQAQIATMQGGLQNAGQQNALFSNMLGAGGQMRGQDFQNQQANRGLDVNQLGMNLNQAQGNQQAMLGQQGQMLNSILQNQGMGNQFAQNAFAQNSQNQQLNNQNGMNMAQQQNAFNLNNAGNIAQFGQAANGLNQNSFTNGQNNWLQALQMGLGQNALGNQNQQNMLNQLFGAFGQATGIGTPQAQITQSPSPGAQALQAGLGLGSAALGGGMFRNARQPPVTPQATMAMPQLPTFNWQNMGGSMTPSYSSGQYAPTIPWRP